MGRKEFIEKGMKWVFALFSLFAIISLGFICYFIFKNGLPFLFKTGWKEMLLGTKWAPTASPPSYGILPMIYGSFIVTLLACLWGVPLGVLTAIYLRWEAKGKKYEFMKSMIQLMAGIPSVIYGFFALQMMAPLVKNYIGGNGLSILTASLLLGVMILPTIIMISESAIAAVPQPYYEAAVALGANHPRAVMRVVLPAAKSGIFSAVILGIGRAIGETMAVAMVVGNQPRITTNILQGIRTMTTNVVQEMAYAEGDHELALLATGCVLFVFILILNAGFTWLKRRSKD